MQLYEWTSHIYCDDKSSDIVLIRHTFFCPSRCRKIYFYIWNFFKDKTILYFYAFFYHNKHKKINVIHVPKLLEGQDLYEFSEVSISDTHDIRSIFVLYPLNLF